MLAMPTRSGWMVEWETGEIIKDRLGNERFRHDSFTSSDKEKIEAKAQELNEAGYKNVKIYECMY